MINLHSLPQEIKEPLVSISGWDFRPSGIADWRIFNPDNNVVYNIPYNFDNTTWTTGTFIRTVEFTVPMADTFEIREIDIPDDL